ncbi:hypothetical protein FDI09_gp35 [Mycobacterium phage Twister]|uniref:Uncharacterized protein n=2 Tax=Fromanvirus twister TaxID=1993863 RepID=H9NCN8_9CAUD|nr:hypothetical protein FDI09_gp35 [Mycobacterium phage Twister]AFF28359.1 hypothetical protein TWISTER_60 [Mycobacterium phage Twister]QGJ94736.1 hypothetical protein SEA_WALTERMCMICKEY_60 [Mycobacterium phage WalterMcMickey]
MTATPNVMPRKVDPLRQSLLGSLIETKPVSWTQKSVAKGPDGKEVVTERKRTRQGLRYPLAQNVSNDNVERAAKRWI